MNWSQFKDRVSCQIFACEVVTPWSLTQEVPVSNIFLTKMLLLNYSENI